MQSRGLKSAAGGLLPKESRSFPSTSPRGSLFLPSCPSEQKHLFARPHQLTVRTDISPPTPTRSPGTRSGSYHESFLEDGAQTLVVTYGVTARAAQDVYHRQKGTGSPFSLLILKTLWPVPETLIREKAEGAKRVIVLEMNDGQYVREIERVLPGKQVDFYGRMNGKLITPSEIREVINHG
jgi:hypothetical protein